MEPWLIAVLLKPFGALILFGLIALPIRLAIERWLPAGWLKEQLLRERWHSCASRKPRHQP